MVRHSPRRSFLASTARLGAVLAAAPWPASAAAPVELRMWTLLSGGDGARMAALVERFNASQRDVRVVSTTLKWGEPFYTKLITSTVVGAGPDLATVHLSRITNLAGGGVLHPIAPAELAAAGLSGADFLPRQWQKALHGGTPYAIPLDVHPLVLYVNKSLAAKAGLLDERGSLRPIAGIDAFSAALRTATARSGQRGLTMESSQSSYALWRLWISMLAQQDVPVIEGGRFGYGRAGVDALARIAGWFMQGDAQVGLNYEASTSQFVGGRAAFMLNGAWEVPQLEHARRTGALGFDYAIVPLPRLYRHTGAWADSHAFALPASDGHPADPVRVRAALQFMAWVARESFGWAEGGHIPAYRPVAESAAARALMPNALYANAAYDAVYDPDAWYMGAAGPVEAIASRFLPAALYGYMTPAQALARFEGEAARLVKRPPPRY